MTDKEAQAGARKCSQCATPAIVVADGLGLCVRCLYMLRVAETLAFRNAVIQYNRAADEIDALIPYGPTTRMQVPDMPKPPMILNNIHVNDSTVGSINTGEVQRIDVTITELHNSGNSNISKAIATFTQSVVNDKSLSDLSKNDLLDQIAYLSAQAASAAKDRKPGMIKAAIDGAKLTAGAIPAIAAAWNSIEPILKGHFGFS